ncbi:MAG: M56 family metallopeptidase [Bacteroidota bacterium]
MNWLYYLAEANIYLSVFYLAYCAFLNTQTYYQLNRVYLIGSCIVAFILPVLQIGALKPAQVVTAAPVVEYQLPVAQYTEQLPVTNNIVQVAAAPTLSTDDYLWFGYLIGAAILLVLLLVKLYSLYKLVNKVSNTKQANYKLIQLPQTDIAFSFFNYLFIGNNAHGAKTIIRHELVHIRQKHSVDIVFLEILKIINWFNPFIYLLQNSLKTVHEYIADEQTVAHENDPISYSTFLLNNAYGTGGPSVTHSFFNYNLLKKRIIMLNQKRSGNLARLRYLVAVPVVVASLCASTLAFSKDYGWIDIAPAKSTENRLTADTKAAFTPLITHLAKTIPYHPSKGDKHGLVEISFTVGDNHKITDAKAINQADSKLISLAENGFKAFEKTIEATPGKYSFDVYFDDKEYWFIHHKTEKAADLAGEVSLWEKQYTNKNGGIVSNTSVRNVYIQLADRTNLSLPVIVINTKRHAFTATEIAKLKAGADIVVTGTPTSYGKDNTYAINTWGHDAKNGAMVLEGEEAGVKIVPAGATEKSDTKTGSIRKMTPPSLAEPGYKNLGAHLLLSLRKNTYSRFRTSQLAIIGFSIKPDHSIADVKILKSAGQQLDNLALAAAKAYKGTVTDNAAEGKFVINFYRNDNTAEHTAIINDAAYKGRLVLDMENGFRSSFLDKSIPKPVVKPDKKVGAATKVDDDKLTYIFYVNGKRHVFTEAEQALLNKGVGVSYKAETTITYKKGIAKNIAKWGAEAKENDIVELSGKSARVWVIEPALGQALPIDPPPIDQSKLVTREFVNYLQENIKFPKYPLDDNFVVTFNVNFTVANNKITDYELTRAEDRLAYVNKPNIKLNTEASDTFRAEILKVIRTAPIDNIGPGRYQIPVAFLYKKSKELFDVIGIMMTKTAKGTLAGVYTPVIKPV